MTPFTESEVVGESFVTHIYPCSVHTRKMNCNVLFVYMHLCVGTLDAVPGVNDDSQMGEQQTVEVALTATILDIIPEEQDVSIAVAVYSATTLFPLFPVRDEPTTEAPEAGEPATSTVVGSQVVSVQVAGVEDGTALTEPVQFVFTLNQIENIDEMVLSNVSCAFWNFSLSGK